MIEASALNMLLTHMLVVRASQYRNGAEAPTGKTRKEMELKPFLDIAIAEVRDNMPYVMQQFQLK